MDRKFIFGLLIGSICSILIGLFIMWVFTSTTSFSQELNIIVGFSTGILIYSIVGMPISVWFALRE